MTNSLRKWSNGWVSLGWRLTWLYSGYFCHAFKNGKLYIHEIIMRHKYKQGFVFFGRINIQLTYFLEQSIKNRRLRRVFKLLFFLARINSKAGRKLQEKREPCWNMSRDIFALYKSLILTETLPWHTGIYSFILHSCSEKSC